MSLPSTAVKVAWSRAREWGGLAERLSKEQTTCVEVSPLRCRVLEAKGHKVINADFLKWAAETHERFDVVVMNPPYSEGRFKLHLNAAAELVKDGGRLGPYCPQAVTATICCLAGTATGLMYMRACLPVRGYLWCAWWHTNRSECPPVNAGRGDPAFFQRAFIICKRRRGPAKNAALRAGISRC